MYRCCCFLTSKHKKVSRTDPLQTSLVQVLMPLRGEWTVSTRAPHWMLFTIGVLLRSIVSKEFNRHQWEKRSSEVQWMILPFPWNLDSSLTIQQHEIICCPWLFYFLRQHFLCNIFCWNFFCIREIIFAKAFNSQEDLGLCCSYSLISFMILSKGFFLINFLVIFPITPSHVFTLGGPK